jgi:hypothetical protein
LNKSEIWHVKLSLNFSLPPERVFFFFQAEISFLPDTASIGHTEQELVTVNRVGGLDASWINYNHGKKGLGKKKTMTRYGRCPAVVIQFDLSEKQCSNTKNPILVGCS